MAGSSFRDLRVWQQAMKLTTEIYRCADQFPKHELYGLSQQIRRAGGVCSEQHSGRQRAPLQ